MKEKIKRRKRVERLLAQALRLDRTTPPSARLPQLAAFSASHECSVEQRSPSAARIGIRSASAVTRTSVQVACQAIVPR
jgi:hypothetical protein